MELKHVRIVLLSSAAVFSPAILLSQSYPDQTTPTQQSQPMSQQQHPGGHRRR